MNQPIELPPEANPLTAQLLYQALHSAASTNQHQIQSSTQQLQRWETQPGYYTLLQASDIFVDQSLAREVRYLAIIQLKNGIDKYWRKTASNAVSKDEKARIRTRLLESGINEADRPLALQNAVLIAKIVRFEFPLDWPDAITSLIDILRASSQSTTSSLHFSRALLILLHVAKELSTARLQRSRTSLQSVTPEIIHVLGRAYIEKVAHWRSFVQIGGDDEGGALECLEQSLLVIKVLRRLLISGFEAPNRDKDVRELWSLSRQHFADFLALVLHNSSNMSTDVVDYIEEHLLQLSKFHLEMARTHPAAFALLPESTELVRAYWSMTAEFGESFGTQSSQPGGTSKALGDDDDDDKPPMERLSLVGLLLLRACIKMVFSPTQTFKYRRPEDKEEQKQSVELIRTHLLTEQLIRQVMETVVTRFFVFRPSDLREWQDEPEEWEQRGEGEGDAWEYSIRPCSEKLFLDLMLNFKEMLVPSLLQVFHSVGGPESGDVLSKDSVYTALGLAASVVHQQIDFDSFITSTLLTELQIRKPGYNILRRRIAILLSQWISVRISAANRPVIYRIFQHLLDRQDEMNDEVVRVTAGRHFKNIVDDWEFKTADLLPFTPAIIARLMALIEEVDLTETKMALLNTVSVMVERLEHHISPHAERIVTLLPSLWEQSGEEYLLKQAILTTMTRLISSMKDESRRYHHLFLPLIDRAMEPGSDEQVFLLDDALELWATILTQTPSPASPQLLALAPHLFSAFELGTENLRKALGITESYVLLAPAYMLADEMRERLFSSAANLLNAVKVESSGLVTSLMEIMIRAAEGLGGESAVEIIGQSLVSQGFLGKILDALRGRWEANQTSGPKRSHAPVDGIVETDYYGVLARLVLASPRVFVQAVEAASPVRGQALGETMDWILEGWFRHFGNMAHPNQRKLNCLALTRMLESGESWILGRLQELMTVWTDVVGELSEGAEERGGDSLLFWDPEGLKPTNPEAPEDERRRHVRFSCLPPPVLDLPICPKNITILTSPPPPN
ncbi:MAG: hypothetical protein M1817_002218 [Caeruleum heppii]|nr:MAG: hypothetical protein M1817_002218 [Caeruleum heppii]